MDRIIREIVEACPRRLAASEDERRAHDMLRAELDAVPGVETRFHDFRYSTHIYANLALHFFVALVGTALLFFSPWLALSLHLLAALSYYLDTTKRALILRRLFPFRPSRNLIATLPAQDELRLRILIIAHIDAAYTGKIFHPDMIRSATQPPRLLRWTRKSLQVAWISVLALALVDGLVLALELSIPLMVAAGLLSIPSLLTVVLNMDVVIRNTIVPGANDNLTGCAGCLELAKRFSAQPLDPNHTELVFIATGAEEASTGGALALANDARALGWSPQDTIVLGVDGLSNGELRGMQDGELFSMPAAPWLLEDIAEVAATDDRFGPVKPFDIPSGGTDVKPFLVRGFDGICIGCVDPDIGAPRHYHWPSDTPDNLDLEQLAVSIDFVEGLVRHIAQSHSIQR